MKLFENSHERDLDVFRDVAYYSYFHRLPIRILLCISLVYALLSAIFSDKKLIGVLFLLFVIVALIGGYHRYIKIFLAREKEMSREPIIHTVSFFEDKIEISSTLGSVSSFDYSMIKSVMCGKSTFLLLTKAKLVITVKRGAFTLGTDAELVDFLRSKGFKVKYKDKKKDK